MNLKFSLVAILLILIYRGIFYKIFDGKRAATTTGRLRLRVADYGKTGSNQFFFVVNRRTLDKLQRDIINYHLDFIFLK